MCTVLWVLLKIRNAFFSSGQSKLRIYTTLSGPMVYASPRHELGAIVRTGQLGGLSLGEIVRLVWVGVSPGGPAILALMTPPRVSFLPLCDAVGFSRDGCSHNVVPSRVRERGALGSQTFC